MQIKGWTRITVVIVTGSKGAGQGSEGHGRGEGQDKPLGRSVSHLVWNSSLCTSVKQPWHGPDLHLSRP